MASFFACTRVLRQSLSFAKVPPIGTLGHTWRFISSTPSFFDDGSVPADSKTEQEGAIVDPEKDGSLQEVLAIPVPKPLIPGATQRSRCHILREAATMSTLDGTPVAVSPSSKL